MKRLSTLPETQIPLPTEAEVEILKVIWGEGRSTVGSVHFKLNECRPRGYTTVLKLMQVMLTKGLLIRTNEERVHFYSSAVSQNLVRVGYVGDLSRRLFDDSLLELASFALGMTAHDGELDDVRSVLDAHADRAWATKADLSRE